MIYWLLTITITYFLRGIILSLLAKLLGLLLEPLNLISAMIIYYKKSGFLKVIHKYQFNSALETDIYLHYNFRALWRVTLGTTKKHKGYIFGTNKDETLSSAIGRKAIQRTLCWHGWFWYIFLYVVDPFNWFKGGHCVSAFNTYKLNTST